MKTKLTPAEITDLVPHIMRVLGTGERWNDESLHLPAGAIIDAVLSIKGMKRRENDDDPRGFSTNGWEWHWWQALTYEGKDYTLDGDGYYGGHSFGLSDE